MLIIQRPVRDQEPLSEGSRGLIHWHGSTSLLIKEFISQHKKFGDGLCLLQFSGLNKYLISPKQLAERNGGMMS